MEIARLITIEEAAQRLGIQPRTLIRYVRSGKIKAKLFRFETMTLIEVRATQDTNGSAARGIEISRMEAGGMNDKKGISQVEAAKKYGVSQQLISRWIRQGLIRVIRPGGRGRSYEIMEEDVARLVEIYREEAARSPHGFKGKRMRSILRRRMLEEESRISEEA
jgi:excisionase family DNA binding protein